MIKVLLTKEVEVKVNSHNVEYYKSLGYEIPMKKASDSTRKRYKKEIVYDFNKTIIVKLEDLLCGSHVEVKVLCDYCGETMMSMPYCVYLTRVALVDKCGCKKCVGKKQVDCNLFKYGVSNISQLDYVQETIKKNNVLKYGVDNYAKTEECREKMKNMTKFLYGVEYYSQTQEYKEKWHNTCTEKYGENYRQQFAEKAFKTFYEKTGYNNPLSSPDVKAQIEQSCLDRYGVSHPAKSIEVRSKIAKTLYEYGTAPTSKHQLYIFYVYNKSGKAELNYPVYYYNTDICFPEEKLIVEYDGGGHDLCVKAGKLTKEEFDQKEIIRNNIIKREGYKIIRIISTKDLLPSDTILFKMLSDARQYFTTTNHHWFEFNIDTSTYRNAETPDGSNYDFGNLRTIKDSDLHTTQIT